MFGGLGFLVNGHLAVSASSRGGLMLRVDPADLESVLVEEGVSPFEMHGRAMNGWVHVDASVAASPDQLDRWVSVGTSTPRPCRRSRGPAARRLSLSRPRNTPSDKGILPGDLSVVGA